MSTEGQNYKDTVNLPKTDFPMKADLVIREPVRLASWESGELYRRIQARRQAQKAPRFLLHDGPPFANGDVHMGTALNKVIKDLVLKSKTMAGFETPYIPGWDCHGLPIEFKVVKEASGLSAPEIRRRSEEFARKWIEVQKASFRRLGVLGDWENPYLTLSAGYEATVMRFFATAVEKNLVYRSQRPVQWSYGAKTALAEAEVEYKEKISPAIFVKFKALTGPVSEAGGSFVIWTTTPWTLPANLGIMVSPGFTYMLGNFRDSEGREETLLIASALVEAFSQKTGFVLDPASAKDILGSALAGSTAWHPFLERESKVIATSFVTDDTGTGQVHTAPGHGMEDYIAGRENGLGLISPVDDDGNFTAEVGLPDLVGKNVFAANEPIIALLTESGHLLGREKYVHQYPFCWRSKLPIIFRSVPQFFLSIDAVREQALAEIDKAQWLPAWGRDRIFGTVKSRPDWCISRQRTWGVPLPVFYKEDGEAVIDAAVARKVAELVEQHGTNVWFEKTDEELCALLGLPETWKKGKDTLDVWIDSGCSSIAVTEARPEYAGNEGIADLYIEATDQHRGWFQSSLMCSVIHRGKAPYKAVMTHGFVTDTTGKKVSKSDQDTATGDAKDGQQVKKPAGKPMTADHYYNKYGADLVRLWVSSVDWQNDVPFSQDLFEQNGEVYRRFRNTLRILLANLGGFDAATQAVTDDSLTLVDRWILERLHNVTAICLAAYAEYDFRKVFITLNQFCAVDLSALYVDLTKDRMYCDALDSPRRRSSQTAMHRVLDSLTRLLAPILAFTADEAWEFAGNTDSVHEQDFPVPDPAFAGTAATDRIAELQKLRDVIFQEVDKARKEKLIGSNLEASVSLTVPADSPAAAALADGAEASEFFILSDFKFEAKSGAVPAATVSRTSNGKCLRCWRHLPDIGVNPAHPQLCGRCTDVLVK
ncbi:MAG: isoleucine--tRNA ligase [Verrucomicrobiota bacterium]